MTFLIEVFEQNVTKDEKYVYNIRAQNRGDCKIGLRIKNIEKT